MTKDLDVNKVLAAMESESVGSNAMSIMDMLKTANTVMSQIEKLMSTAEKMGLKPLLVRGLGAQLKIDAETPLRSDESVMPKTPLHQQVFNNLNTMTEEQLMEIFTDATPDDQSSTDTD